ncbi:MAG: hypothetical protein EZS28_050948, partial [Streblomastix strix]
MDILQIRSIRGLITQRKIIRAMRIAGIVFFALAVLLLTLVLIITIQYIIQPQSEQLTEQLRYVMQYG